MDGRDQSPLFEETEEDKAYFEQQMTQIAGESDYWRALIGVNKRCIYCGHIFAVGGSDEEKCATNACDTCGEEEARRQEREVLAEMESRQYRDYLDGLIVYGRQY